MKVTKDQLTKREEVLRVAFEKLQSELEKEPLSPERVSALTEAIKAIAEINPLALR